MKYAKLSELPVRPENYEIDNYNKIDYKSVFSQMSPVERRFVNGLLRYYQPKRVLEIGVSRGGGTVNILNAISDMPDASLFSIDVTTADWCGAEAKKIFPALKNKWRLITGKDPSEIVPELAENGKFDFAVIDSLHLHPVESLNFLSILPYLNDGAIVVLHDVSLFAFSKENRSKLAPRILYSAVAADKLEPFYGGEMHENSMPGVTNIAAMQVSGDTWKYVGNIFDGLLHPWEYFPFGYLDSARALFAKHYSEEDNAKADKARELSGTWLFSGKRTFSTEKLRAMWADKFSVPTVFYGAGYHMRNLLDRFHEFDIPLRAEIWDIDAERIGEIKGHKVRPPDFETYAEGRTAVIMIEDGAVAREIRAKLEPLGYRVYHGINEYMICEE